MPLKAKIYLSAVFAVAAAVLAGSTWNAAWPGVTLYGSFLLAAVLASAVKLRLPGLSGVYSFNFLVLLFGLLEFDTAPVLAAGVLCALAQSFLNAKKRPKPIQVIFNAANLIVSLGACAAVYRVMLQHSVGFRPAVLALIAALYFVINTGLVSCVLWLAEGKRLAEACEEWYFWSFPYFLTGAACLGFLPRAGELAFGGELWLIVVPLLYLLHFFYGISTGRHPSMPAGSDDSAAAPHLPGAAMRFLGMVAALGFAVSAYAVPQWSSADPLRFAAFAALALIVSTWKVRLPGLTGTISLNFVVLLVAIMELRLAEVVILCAATGAVQCLWKPKRRPPAYQVLFNVFTLVLSGSSAYLVCRWGIGASLPLSMALPVAVIVAYGVNSALVSTIICLAEAKPLGTIWQNFNFWLQPYYMVGGVAAGLMIATLRAAGWAPSLMVLPAVMLVYVSYNAHVSVAKRKMVAA